MADAGATVTKTSSTSPGLRLQQAREAAGLSREQLAKQTKILERHLEALEADRFAALPGRTYAIGFSRSYARAVGLDEAEIAREVRGALGLATTTPAPLTSQPIELPAYRRKPRNHSIAAAAILSLSVVIAAIFFWPRNSEPTIRIPLGASNQGARQAVSTAPSAVAPGAALDQGPVVLTAEAQTVWLQIKDASGKQIMQKELAPGESFTIPADTQGPLLSTAHPEALAISVGGRPVAKLSDRQKTLRNVPVSPATLLGAARQRTTAGP